MQSGCASDRNEANCNAAASYLSNELSAADGEEFVFETHNDDSMFGGPWLTESEKAESVSQIVDLPWLEFEGTSVWQAKTSDEVAITPDEIGLFKKLLASQGVENAVTRCPAITAVLSERGISYGDSAVKSVSAITNPELDPEVDQHSKTITSLYLPVLSDDGQSALLVDSRSWGPLEGVGLIVKIERQSNGEWLPTRWQMMWVS
jgi:hypothetical protein